MHSEMRISLGGRARANSTLLRASRIDTRTNGRLILVLWSTRPTEFFNYHSPLAGRKVENKRRWKGKKVVRGGECGGSDDDDDVAVVVAVVVALAAFFPGKESAPADKIQARKNIPEDARGVRCQRVSISIDVSQKVWFTLRRLREERGGGAG